MSDKNTIDILKSAILLEMRGISFYSQVASQAQDEKVREFFQLMVKEEESHRDLLKNQLAFYDKEQKFKAGTFVTDNSSQVSSKILNEAVRSKINAAGYEAAAISAAINMEKAAVDLYSSRAQETQDPEEKVLYNWLAGWENVHLKELQEIDEDLKKDIWMDNNFWPF